MLTILLGTDWKRNRREILSRIARDVSNGAGNRVLLVPELISHDTERRLCEAAGDATSRYAEVLSFSRLAQRVADAANCSMDACLDEGGRVVAMAAAIRQLHNKLKAYAAVESRPEFLTGLVDAVDEFKRCCISSVDLRAAAARTEGALAQKLEELALIFDSYNSITSRGKRDPRDQMTLVLEQMEASDYAQGHVFYIDGFPDFTRQHSAVVEHLIQNSAQVTISINCDTPGSSRMAFQKAGKTALDFISFAKSAQIPYRIETTEPEPSALTDMRSLLFQGAAVPVPGVEKHLRVCSADSILEECRSTAASILELVRGGCRYRDIAVVCGDMTAYENTIRLVFSGCGIPVYRSGTDDILQKTVIRSLLSALETALGGFERQDVLRYLKSVLSPLDQHTCDLLENYCIVWGISGSAWTKQWENHPDGLGVKPTEQSRKRLLELNTARARLMDPLVHLRQGFDEASNLSGQVQALCHFFEEISLADRLSALADRMDAAGDNRTAQILNQLWDILLDALEQLHDVLGDTFWEAESFTRLFMLLLSRYSVGTIPTVLDAVMAGPVSAMRLHQVKHLFVLGAQEGDLPGYSGTTGILTDREREMLRSLDVPLTGGGMEGLHSEFAEIYGVFCAAETSVQISYAGGQPSFIHTRLGTMAGREEKMENSAARIMTDRQDAAACLVSYARKDDAQSLGILPEYEEIASRAAYSLGNVSGSNIQGLYGNVLNLSASQIDKQAGCRFAYFMRYGLHAKELKEASVDPAEFGTYFHSVLEQTARKVMELGGFHVVSVERTLELAKEFSDAYIAQRFSALDSNRLTYLFERNMQELLFLVRELWNELSVSQFAPDQFEVGFGSGEAMPAVSVPGADIPAQIGGFVDRVDKWNDGVNNYFRVVDYKSGKKSFDYCDIFNGIGLQMLLYMFALEQGGEEVLGSHPIPVGVQYFSARYLYLPSEHRQTEEEAWKDREKTLVRKGLVLQDDAVLDAMQPDGAPQRLQAKRNKDGQYAGDLADREQFAMLRTYVFQILKNLVNEIASGNVSPNPYTRGQYGACSFCPYGTVCHKATVEGRRNYKEMKAPWFWEEVEKEVSKDG